MSEKAPTYFKEFEARLNKRLDYSFDAIDKKFTQIDKRFDFMEQRFDAMDHRFDVLESKFAHLEKKVDIHGEEIIDLQKKTNMLESAYV